MFEMITAKKYENEIYKTFRKLEQIYDNSINGEDLKITEDQVKFVCLELLTLSWRFQGQEEADLAPLSIPAHILPLDSPESA